MPKKSHFNYDALNDTCYLDRKAVCEYLQISPSTLMKLRKDGLRCYKIGGNIRFTKEDVDAFINARVM